MKNATLRQLKVFEAEEAMARRRRIPIADLLRGHFIVRERGADTWTPMEQAFGRRPGRLEVLDAQGFPLRLNRYVVHRRSKRLPPVALAFRSSLADGPDRA